jgi:putative PIN family toxin of toxin-antitoxin system
MVSRKRRLLVVVDTNVFIRGLKTRRAANPNRRIIRLWLLEKRLQLVVSQELIQEYLEIFADVLGMGASLIEEWRFRFEQDSRVTVIRLGRRYTESRDPDDNVLLAIARAGKSRYLITNDRDLLELPAELHRTLPFAIRTPQEFLREFEENRPSQ